MGLDLMQEDYDGMKEVVVTLKKGKQQLRKVQGSPQQVLPWVCQ